MVCAGLLRHHESNKVVRIDVVVETKSWVVSGDCGLGARVEKGADGERSSVSYHRG